MAALAPPASANHPPHWRYASQAIRQEKAQALEVVSETKIFQQLWRRVLKFLQGVGPYAASDDAYPAGFNNCYRMGPLLRNAQEMLM